MKLQELYIKDYKVLQDFTLMFDEQSSISVLIGENGSGKTTVVECLTLIFAELYRHKTVRGLFEQRSFPFAFRLRYVLSTGPQVDFDYEHENREATPYIYDGSLEVQFTYDDELSVEVQNEGSTYNTPDLLTEFLQSEGFSTRQLSYLLPSNVVLYYSGISDILETIVDRYQQQLISGSLDGQATSSSELFYFKPENFPVLLIGLLSFQYGNIPERLATSFGIDEGTSFHYIAIRVCRPRWAKPRSTPEQFWGAKGDLEVFLQVLRDKTDTEFGSDHVTFNIFNREQLTDVWSFYGQEKSLFEHLVTLQANGLIERIEVNLGKGRDLIIPYQRLSEGEKQLLIIMALRELLAAGENTLFLFDEPDTYLHPEWKRNFIAHFQAESPATENFLAYYLITTHSPGIVSGMRKKQLHILRKEDGRSVPKVFTFDPYGKPEDDILFDFFGITGLRYQPVEHILNELGELINRGQYETDRFRELLEQMERELGRDDMGLTRLKLEIARRRRAA